MLKEDINKAINENLPAMVGNELKEVLTRAEKDAVRLTLLESDLRIANQKLKEAEVLKLFKADLDAIGQKQVMKGIELDKREAVLTVREEFAKIRVDEIRGVVKDVFANSRYKYYESGSIPISNGPGQYGTTSAPFNKTTDVTTE